MAVYFSIFAVCAAAAVFGRFRYATVFMVVTLVLFVGLRYETGFDWPVYKAEWAHLFHQWDIGRVIAYQPRYHEELGFLALLTGLTWLFPQYEYAQFFISSGLILSTIYIITTFRTHNVALCLAIVVSYLVFSLFFSVVRQSVAVSVFNVGLSLYFRDRRRVGVVVIIVSAVFQYSAIIYIFAFFAALLGKRYVASASLARWTLAIIVSALVLEAALFVCGHFLSVYLPPRIATYVNVPLGLDPWSLMMFAAFAIMAVHASWVPKNVDLDEEHSEFRWLLAILGGITAGSALVPILRERAAYEFWILYAIYVCMAGTILRRAAISCALAFGVCCSAVLFKYPTSLMLLPYQNFAISAVFGIPSTAQVRYDAFIAIVGDNMDAGSGHLLPHVGPPSSHGRSEWPVQAEHALARR